MWEKLVPLNHPALSSIGEEVDFNSEETQRIITELKEMLTFLQQHNMGVGLAAAQLGYAKKIFIICIPEERASREVCEPFPMTVFINSRIACLDEEDIITGPEGCFSLPGVRVQGVSRYNTIKITYVDEQGHSQERIMRGFSARVAQHEGDHEQGIEMRAPNSGLPDQFCCCNFPALTEWVEGKLAKRTEDSSVSCSFNL